MIVPTLRRGWVAAIAVLVGMACASNPQPAAAPPVAQSDAEAFDTAPVLETYVEPDYPEYAKRNHIEGTVTLELVVSAKGRVESVRVLESSDRMFDEPAVKAAREFRFKPALKGGEPVRSVVTVPVHFR
jgi:TonB family protein